METLLIIVLSVTAFIWATDKIKNTLGQKFNIQHNKSIQTMAQAGFLAQMLTDKTEVAFYNKTKDEVFATGQSLLWDEVNNYNNIFSNAINNGIKDNDHKLINSAVKIVKITHSIFLVERDGVFNVPLDKS